MQVSEYIDNQLGLMRTAVEIPKNVDFELIDHYGNLWDLATYFRPNKLNKVLI